MAGRSSALTPLQKMPVSEKQWQSVEALRGKVISSGAISLLNARGFAVRIEHGSWRIEWVGHVHHNRHPRPVFNPVYQSAAAYKAAEAEMRIAERRRAAYVRVASALSSMVAGLGRLFR